MLKPLLVAALIAALTASAISTAYLVVNFNIGVNVPTSPTSKEFTINLSVDRPSGSEYLGNLTVLMVRSPVMVRFRAEVLGVEGNFSLSLSGSATLESNERIYKVMMPCIAALGGARCFRVMHLIPGWDSPLAIAPGDYRVSLRIGWMDASGSGVLRLRIKLLNLGSPESRCGPPSIKVIGTKPSSTDGWVTAEGSTRSYSMLTSKPVRLGVCCSVNAWVWFFNPAMKQHIKEVTIRISDSAGHLIKQESIQLRHTGTYSEALLSINLSSGMDYVITALSGKANLTAKVRCG